MKVSVKASTVLFVLGTFVVGLVFMFPLQNVRGFLFEKIYKNTGILLVADDIYPLFLGWPGMGIKNVSATLPVGLSDIELFSEKMHVRLRPTSFFPPIPGVSLYLKSLKGGGDLFLMVGKYDPKISFQMDADAVNLEQISIPGIGQGIPGIMDTALSGTFNLADLSSSTGVFNIRASRLKSPNYLVSNPMLGPPFQIPGMNIGELTIKSQIRNGTVEISTFQFGSAKSDLSGSLTGDIKLGKDYLATLLNITLNLKISETIINNPENKTFLDFLGSYKKSTPGEYGLRWSATIQEILSLAKALPVPAR